VKGRRARDQQKWSPVLRSIARQPSLAHDLIVEPEATLPDHALAAFLFAGVDGTCFGDLYRPP
jgi:hypothetical protein